MSRLYSLDTQYSPMIRGYNITYYDKYEWGWIEVELPLGTYRLDEYSTQMLTRNASSKGKRTGMSVVLNQILPRTSPRLKMMVSNLSGSMQHGHHRFYINMRLPYGKI